MWLRVAFLTSVYISLEARDGEKGELENMGLGRRPGWLSLSMNICRK